jgi:serine/threonine protein kinase
MSLINNKYKILCEIGRGSFGKIYKGKNIRTGELVAIKTEPILGGNNLLKNESTVYRYLINMTGIPSIKWYGKDESNYYMVINLLGCSLEKLKCDIGKLPLNSVLKIGIRIIKILEEIHNKGLVHRDIKPDNFLVGNNTVKNDIYLIDFGLCKKISDKEFFTSGIIGSINYVSINGHNLVDLTQRDDVESVIYMLIYFYLGDLPWSGLTSENVKIMKETIESNTKIPIILKIALNHVRGLGFGQSPKYKLMVELFERGSNY